MSSSGLNPIRLINMPYNIRKISDICRELGLICTLSKAPREMNPDISRLYKALGAVSYAYRNDGPEIIRGEYVAASKLSDLSLASFGPRIWSSRSTERAGVLRAGEERANGLCPKDLYWDDPVDRALYALKLDQPISLINTDAAIYTASKQLSVI